MLQVVLFLVISTLLAYAIQQSNVYIRYNGDPWNCGWQLHSGKNYICYIIFLLFAIFFVGLRQRGNDTPIYLINYLTQITAFPGELNGMKWSLGANPGFQIYQSLIKLVFGNNGLWLTMVTAIISTISLFEFYRRYSINFIFSIYLLIASTLFTFTMGAMKQVLAFSIGIWILPLAIQKKWSVIAILLFIACSIHTYVLFYAAIPILIGKMFSWKVKACFVVSIFIGSHLMAFMEKALVITETFGDEYQIEYWTEGTGVNILRVPIFLVTPILGLIFKKEIQKIGNVFVNGCINLSVISSCFMILAIFGGANMFGRMAIYWEPFTFIALPGICQSLKKRSWYKTFLSGLVLCFLFFYIYSYKKIGYSLLIDYYHHANILDLF